MDRAVRPGGIGRSPKGSGHLREPAGAAGPASISSQMVRSRATHPIRMGRHRSDQKASSGMFMMSVSIAAMISLVAVSVGSTFFAKKLATPTLPV